MINLYDFFLSHLTEIAGQTIEHIGLTLVALVIAIITGLPLGILLTKYRKISSIVLGGVGIIQTIPSIALLGFLLPLLGIGPTPAIVALFLYALLPIVRNTFTGIKEVEPSVTEAARGMGMSDMQILRNVEIPLAMPVIFAGIRTATVINVGVATLCALIASGGLGQFIFRGIALNNMNMILAGAIPAAILALSFDFLLSLLQKYINQVIKPLLILSSVTVFVIIPLLLIPSLFSHSFRAGFTAEFMERSDGYQGLKQRYNISMDTVELDPGLMYQALRKKEVDVISGFTTDGRIKAYQFQALEDDKLYFPPYYATPLIRGEALRRFPLLYEIFSNLEGKISNDIMSELNFRVDHTKKDPSQVAKDFLSNIGFKTSERKQGKADIVIGSKNFTEQYILAEIFRLLIENYSDLNVELKTGLAGTKICFDALVNGEIDLYPEYTGTGLLVILKADEKVRNSIIMDKDKVYIYVSEESKRRFDIEWLQPLGFNNTYALMMREKQAGNLEIETISDLKNYLDKLDR